jgi:hypothetical protein
MKQERASSTGSNPVPRIPHFAMKRFSIFSCLGIMNNVKNSLSGEARFSKIAFSTPELRNRKAVKGYLDFLEEAGLLEKKKEPRTTLFNPYKTRVFKRWDVSVYYLTMAGHAFLRLFPQDVNFKTRMARPNFVTIKNLLEEVKDVHRLDRMFGTLNRSDLRDYLLLLCRLGWLSRVESNDPEISLSPNKSITSFEITDTGSAFLSLFQEGVRDGNHGVHYVEEK